MFICKKCSNFEKKIHFLKKMYNLKKMFKFKKVFRWQFEDFNRGDAPKLDVENFNRWQFEFRSHVCNASNEL